MAQIYLLFVFFLFARAEVLQETSPNSVETYSREIDAVLSNLNAAPFKAYSYESARLLNAHKKADVVELNLDVTVKCNGNYPEIPCDDDQLTCDAFVRQGEVLGDVKCAPKLRIVVEDVIPAGNGYQVSENPQEKQSIVLSHEAVSSESGAENAFVAIRRDKAPCMGCPFDLDPHVVGVNELVDVALRHVESEREKKQALVKVLRLQQQVVSGVKYILLIEIAPSQCDDQTSKPCPSEVCKIEYFQKPWISEDKHVVSNNCTQSQEYSYIKNDLDNEIIPPPIHQRLHLDNSDWLAEMESQIAFDPEPTAPVYKAAPETPQEYVVLSTVATQPILLYPTYFTEQLPSVSTPLEDTPRNVENTEAITDQNESKSSSEESSEEQGGKKAKTKSSEESSEEQGGKKAKTKNSEESSEEQGGKKAKTKSSEESDESSEEDDRRDLRSKLAGKDSSEEDKSSNNSSKSAEKKTENYSKSRESVSTSKSSEEKSRPKRYTQFGSDEKFFSNAKPLLSKLPKFSSESVSSESRSSDESTRHKRAVRQLEKITSEEKALVSNLADYVASAMDNIDDDDNKRIVLQIVRAKKTPAPDGIYYHLILRMGVSHCLEEKADSNCHEKLMEDYVKICKVQVHVQPDQTNPRIVKSQCQNIKRDKNARNRTNYSRYKREFIAGGQSPIDKNGSLVQNLVQESLVHLDAQSSQENKLKPIEIMSATSQVVAGVMYRIKVKLALSDCAKNDQKEVGSCGVLKPEDEAKVCEIKVWEQAWLNSRKFEINCPNEQQYSFEKNDRRRKRMITGASNDVITGAPSDIPFDGAIRTKRAATAPEDITSDSSAVLEYLESPLQYLDAESQHLNKYKAYKIVRAIRQLSSIRSGDVFIRAYIVLSDCDKNEQTDRSQCRNQADVLEKLCDFDISVSRSSPFKIQITCENEGKPHVFHPKGRHDFFIGAPSDVPLDSSSVQKNLEIALFHLDEESPHATMYKIGSILKATSQMVAGILDGITASIILTECNKNQQISRSECRSLPGARQKWCNFELWTKFGNPDRQIDIACENEGKTHSFHSSSAKQRSQLLNDLFANRNTFAEPIRISFEGNTHSFHPSPPRQRSQHLNDISTGGMVGGPIDIAFDSDTVQDNLENALQHLDAESPHTNKYTIGNIRKATSQVVAGAMYRITASIFLSECNKNQQIHRSECRALPGAPEKLCNFKIWSRPWLFESKIDITCEGDEKPVSYVDKRTKRAIQLGGQNETDVALVGGESQRPVDSPEIQALLNTALDKLDQQTNDTNKYKVQEVLSATSQVVAGALHRIKAKIVLSDCAKTSTKNRTDCAPNPGSAVEECSFEILEQPWAPENGKIEISCNNRQFAFRAKRSAQKLLGRDDHDTQFNEFMDYVKQFNKVYSNETEIEYRFKVFRDNMKRIRLLNAYEQGSAIYGPTIHADLTRTEFTRRLGLRTDLRQENAIPLPNAEIPDIELPASFDWRQKKAVTPVKNQGACGSCWAFSVTGNIEGQYAIKYGNLLEFSEQELVDCDKEDQGCNGGLMDQAYTQIERIGGLESEQDYPYDAEDEKCHFNKTKVKVQVASAVNISQDETEMAKWLVQNGPISIGINANAMQFYVGGVSHPFKFLCNPNSLDHGVLVVGYGVHTYPKFNKSLPYWIVKNSWGERWGEQGYYRVYRGDGTCGLNQTPTSAVIV